MYFVNLIPLTYVESVSVSFNSLHLNEVKTPYPVITIIINSGRKLKKK